MRPKQANDGPAPRPRRDRAATRRRLLEAARELFAEHGYDHVSVRAIAARAEANVALVNRYFGSKAALFGEVLAGESALPHVLEGEAVELPGRLAEHVVRLIHHGQAGPVLRTLDRSVGDPQIQPIIRRHLERILVEPLAARLQGPDARLRATAAASIVMGIGSVRRILGLADLRAADPEALTAHLTAMFAAALAPLPEPGRDG